MSLLLKALQNAAKNREAAAASGTEPGVAATENREPTASELTLEPVQPSVRARSSTSRPAQSTEETSAERPASPSPQQAQSVLRAGARSMPPPVSRPGTFSLIARRPLVAFSTAAGLFAVGYGVYLYLQIMNPGLFVARRTPPPAPPASPSVATAPVPQQPVPPAPSAPPPAAAIAPPASIALQPELALGSPAGPGDAAPAAVAPGTPPTPGSVAPSLRATPAAPFAPSAPTGPMATPTQQPPAATPPQPPQPSLSGNIARAPASPQAAPSPASAAPSAPTVARQDPPAARGDFVGSVPTSQPRPAPKASRATRPQPGDGLAPAAGPQVIPVDATLASAYQSLESGRIEDAERLYRQVLASDGRSVDAMLGLASTLTQQSKGDAATQLYMRVLEQDPRNTYAQAGLLNLGGRADPPAAESRLKQLIARDPSAFLYFTLGNLYSEQGQWAAAQGAYFQAHNLAPDNPDYAFNLAVGLEHVSQPKLALDYYRRAVALAQARGHAQFEVARVQTRIGSLEAVLTERP